MSPRHIRWATTTGTAGIVATPLATDSDSRAADAGAAGSVAAQKSTPKFWLTSLALSGANGDADVDLKVIATRLGVDRHSWLDLARLRNPFGLALVRVVGTILALFIWHLLPRKQGIIRLQRIELTH